VVQSFCCPPLAKTVSLESIIDFMIDINLACDLDCGLLEGLNFCICNFL